MEMEKVRGIVTVAIGLALTVAWVGLLGYWLLGSAVASVLGFLA
jgi:hypothetical protein